MTKNIVSLFAIIGVLCYITSICFSGTINKHETKIQKEFERINYRIQNPDPRKSHRARVYLGSDQNDIPALTLTKILFDTESYDIGDNFDVSTSSYVVSTTGYYRIVLVVQWEGAELVNDTALQINIRINDTYSSVATGHVNNSGVLLTLSIVDFMELTAKDEITFWAYSYSGTGNEDLDGTKTVAIIQLMK